jgi:hypothetical protein
MEGVPSLQELAVIGALLVGATSLLLIAWRLLRSYLRDQWSGFYDPSPWRLLWAGASAVAGGGVLWLLWSQLEHIAARMGVSVVVLVLLLVSETRSGGKRRR